MQYRPFRRDHGTRQSAIGPVDPQEFAKSHSGGGAVEGRRAPVERDHPPNMGQWRHIDTARPIAEQRVGLSPRELESLNLAFEGLTARETAARMDCSERTVNYHLANAMAKLQTDNKLAAVQRACWIGLI